MKTSTTIFVSFFLLIVSACTNKKKKEKIDHPNVIVILSDDQGWGDLSRNGNKDIQTPNIDKLAESGASFENFYVAAVCSPTRAEFLTGRYAVRSGVYSTSAGGERLDLDEQTIADIFKQNGYQTAAYGKWHNGMQYPYHPNARGFDDFYGYCSGHWGSYFSPMLEHNGKIVKGEGYLTNKALDFIDKNKRTPFFLYLPLNTPHSPMQVPDSLWSRFKDKKIDPNHRYHEKEDVEHTKAALAMCENIDWNVGRVISKLKELELEENTIVVYFSDNGPNGYRYNGGMKGKKGQVDEGGVKTPFYIQWKGKVEAGGRLQQIAGGIDLLPTLAEMAGLKYETKKKTDGKSLTPLLIEGKSKAIHNYLVNHWKGKTSVRNQNFRLDENNQLFNMVDDPGQSKNVSNQYPRVLEEMLLYKQSWVKNVLSELPQKDERTFTVGHPDCIYNHLPARDAKAHGNIQRSNQWPNCSFFTNWTNVDDSISWEIEVLDKGNFETIVYYTCSKENLGSIIELKFGNASVSKKITQEHNPPLYGMEKDRIPRQESYVKDFKPLNLGTIRLEKGKGNLVLKANELAGKEVMDFRLLILKRIN